MLNYLFNLLADLLGLRCRVVVPVRNRVTRDNARTHRVIVR